MIKKSHFIKAVAGVYKINTGGQIVEQVKVQPSQKAILQLGVSTLNVLLRNKLSEGQETDQPLKGQLIELCK